MLTYVLCSMIVLMLSALLEEQPMCQWLSRILGMLDHITTEVSLVELYSNCG